ncbi:DgyrCDS13465 [Dimorphilus gyrociliatus]|uniref:DgyrCDS13465 n=1 Tax=Dimorphilus gyrociliatus TaxID=2664684 RepID=A0A7I8WAT0_9ANNE|nr:DgyrCDS13465 [Dimorphilus gyrociliatus]
MAAKYFSAADIEEFRDCFYFYAKEKVISDTKLLSTVMRSLGFSPTITEIDQYFKKNEKDNRIDFATFLEVLHQHMEKEKCQQDLLNAFKAFDKNQTGTISYNDFYHLLTATGERLSGSDVDKIFKEAGVSKGQPIKYKEFMKVVLTPLPDY